VFGHAHTRHPQASRGSLVPHLGHGQQRLLPTLADAGVTTTTSPLHYMRHNRELALFSSADPPLGLALDPLSNLRQLPASHRGAAFRAQPHGNGPAFSPNAEPLDAAAVEALAEDPLDAQRAHGATLLLTTYHLCGGLDTRARRLDLALARAGVAHFETERMDQPAEHAAVGLRRELFATLAVERGLVAAPHAVDALAAAYLELDVAGFWVKIEGFSERAPARELRGAAALLGALSQSGRPVVCCGPGRLHLALLVADISSSVGLGEGERFTIPDAGRPRHTGPRQRSAYHSTFLRSFKAGAEPSRRAFASSPCRCGHHPNRESPRGGAIDEHCAVVRAREAREAAQGSREERREWLQATAAMASDLGHDAGVDVVPSPPLAAVLAGVDAGRGGVAAVA
jgi:hypothetical protein